MKYDVLWKKTWKKLTLFTSIMIAIPLSLGLYSRYQEFNSYEKTFEHISPFELVVFIAGISGGISLMIALFIKFAAVEVKDGYLTGRNYWYFKRRLPVSEIQRIYPFSHKGVEAMVADAGSFGKVYIPKHTEKMHELLEYLESHMKSA